MIFFRLMWNRGRRRELDSAVAFHLPCLDRSVSAKDWLLSQFPFLRFVSPCFWFFCCCCHKFAGFRSKPISCARKQTINEMKTELLFYSFWSWEICYILNLFSQQLFICFDSFKKNVRIRISVSNSTGPEIIVIYATPPLKVWCT